jgi:hypothetical protein
LEWHIGVARVACSRVCAGGHHNSQQAQLLNFRFRERLFSYFRFAVMESKAFQLPQIRLLADRYNQLKK